MRAHLTVDPHFAVGPINRRLFGSFVEHLGRCVYEGIYEPGHPTADAEGFRQDVMELVREMGVTTIRYPGGNFVSGYRWEDGIGPVERRPRRLDLAWHSIETNEVGIDEFSGWVKKVDCELMYAVNLGTRGVLEALDVLEYSNIRSGTHWSDMRVGNGHADPHDIRMWCLGNEMDGPWQLGHSTARAYAELAAQTARAMRQLDPDLELVACGSSSAQMPTFGEWERVVLEETYDLVDFISCHAYYEPREGDYATYLASAVNMDRFIDAVVATADHVKALRGSEKTINISFDEWNVWYQSRYEQEERLTSVDTWPVAPRLLEHSYTVMDAVVLGNLLISLVRHADRVTAASIAQLVNAIAPIMTEPGGAAWKQTIFHPFSLTSKLARGVALELKLESPTYDTALYGEVAVVDAVATHDPAGGTTVFAVNRSLTDKVTLEVDTRALGPVARASATSIFDDDVHAANSATEPDRVCPRENDSVDVAEGMLRMTLPACSWTVLTVD